MPPLPIPINKKSEIWFAKQRIKLIKDSIKQIRCPQSETSRIKLLQLKSILVEEQQILQWLTGLPE